MAAMKDISIRLEELRAALRAENISQGELIELQGLAEFIEPGDVELLEPAGVPEFPDEPDEPGTEYLNHEAAGFTVSLTRADDGAMLVQIDTEDEPYGEHVLRVYVNDGRVFDGADEPIIEDGRPCACGAPVSDHVMSDHPGYPALIGYAKPTD